MYRYQMAVVSAKPVLHCVKLIKRLGFTSSKRPPPKKACSCSIVVGFAPRSRRRRDPSSLHLASRLVSAHWDWSLQDHAYEPTSTSRETSMTESIPGISRLGDVDWVKEMLEARGGASKAVNERDQEGNTGVMTAAKEGHVNVVEQLLRCGADVDAVNSQGDSALVCAATEGHEEVVRALLKHGACVDGKGDGNSALHGAVSGGHVGVAGMLLAKEAQSDARDCYGRTALHLAAFHGHMELLQLLACHNANVDAVSEEGWTPLHYAAQGGHVEVVTELLKRGADERVRDPEGHTAMDLATHSNLTDVVTAMQEYSTSSA